jgi:predicted nucleic acid-binding protein
MEIVCVDSNILIDFWRAKQNDKQNTVLAKLSKQYLLAVSSVVVYELLKGDKSESDIFWNSFFSKVQVLDFDYPTAQEASAIYHQLKTEGKMISIEDILIAASAIKHNIQLASANKKHFENMNSLKLIDIDNLR